MDDRYISLLEKTADYAKGYISKRSAMPPFPGKSALEGLEKLGEDLPECSCNPEDVLEKLCGIGGSAVAEYGSGRYFGFVSGGLLPVAHAAAWLADTWNQNAALYAMSPVAAKLEDLCEKWVAELLGLEKGTAMGLVSGSANALICALAAARNALLKKQGYDLPENGLRNAPLIRVVMGEDAHSTVSSALSVLGIGKAEVELVPTDEYGRIQAELVPELDSRTLLILQAGNVTGGSFDPFQTLCDKARDAGAWVHIDGAFGLWAAASEKYRHLTAGIEKADSWSLDAHKTLNAGYDCGIVLCRHQEAFASALQASGSYIQYTENRDGMRYTTEMSRRARSIVLWAVLEQLGREGVAGLVEQLCENTAYFAEELAKKGIPPLTPACFNQFMVKTGTPEKTAEMLKYIQGSGVCWCSGGSWKGEPVIRVSVCSVQTTKKDIDRSVAVFSEAFAKVNEKGN